MTSVFISLYLFPFFHTGNGRSRTAVPKSRQAKRPGGVKKASVLMKDKDTKMCPIFLEDEGQTVQLHRSLSAVPLRLLRSVAAACAFMRSCRRYAAL